MKYLLRYAEAALYAALYVVLLWGVFSLLGEPFWMRHHSFGVLTLLFVVSLFSHAAGQGSKANR